MKVIAFLTEHPVVDRITDHLKLTFVAESPRRPIMPSRRSPWWRLRRMRIQRAGDLDAEGKVSRRFGRLSGNPD